jgi:hypothetical protein
MKKIVGDRGSGKTTHLIKESAETFYYIVCLDATEVDMIIRMARRLKLDIPHPLTYEEFLERRYSPYGVKGLLIDNVDRLVRYISMVTVYTITLRPSDPEPPKEPEYKLISPPKNRFI